MWRQVQTQYLSQYRHGLQKVKVHNCVVYIVDKIQNIDYVMQQLLFVSMIAMSEHLFYVYIVYYLYVILTQKSHHGPMIMII